MGRHKLEDTQVLEVREAMTQAAVDLFRRGGVDAITFRELGFALGVSHVTPYRYFQSKDDLMAAVRTAVFADFDAAVRKADRPSLDAAQRLRRIWRSVIRFGRERPQDYGLLFGRMLPSDVDYQPLRQARRRTLEYVCSVYRAGVEQGQLSGDPEVAVQLMFSAVHGLIDLHAAGQLVEASLSVDELLEQMLDALIVRAGRARR